VPSLVPPEVHSQLLCFVDAEGNAVYLAPCSQSAFLLSVGCLVVVGNQAYYWHVISELDDRVVCCQAVVGIQGVQEGTEEASLWGPCVEDQWRRANVAYLQKLGFKYCIP
jgi:hypothetical protein